MALRWDYGENTMRIRRDYDEITAALRKQYVRTMYAIRVQYDSIACRRCKEAGKQRAALFGDWAGEAQFFKYQFYLQGGKVAAGTLAQA